MIVAGLCGLWIGLVALAIYRMTTQIGAVPLPWGVVLSVLTLAAVCVAGAQLAGAAAALATGAGWFVVIAVATLWMPGGDVLLGADGYTLVLAAGGMLAIGVVVIATSNRAG